MLNLRVIQVLKQKIFLFIAIHFPLFSQDLVSYSKIDPILKSIWEKTYPIEYSKVIKKDLIGKGILVLRGKQGNIYLYTFLVSFPKVQIEEGNLKVETKDFKQIEVKLYFDPKREEPYWIELGEITEFYDKSKILRYVP